MPTAYTSLLGLALPVQGELLGTWGDTVNTAVTSLVETAISGNTTLSTDADVTLTTTQGSANQARAAILICSGARTALRNITAPAASKYYTVVNSTTGGFDVVIRGVGPTTGVTVPNGKTLLVVWNGTDFTAVSVTAASFSGTLAIANGGTGATSAAAALAALGGAGLNSPAFTGTPTAPTAAALTNTTQVATCAFVVATSLAATLPGQTGNAGKSIVTDGTTASWGQPPASAIFLSVNFGGL